MLLIFERAFFRGDFRMGLSKLQYTSLPVPTGSAAVFLQKAVDWYRALSFFQDERPSSVALGSERLRVQEREPRNSPSYSVGTTYGSTTGEGENRDHQN